MYYRRKNDQKDLEKICKINWKANGLTQKIYNLHLPYVFRKK